MTLQQLQYIIAVDEHRHFGRAAEACFVTQATLSLMIKKLEDELGTKLFDRSRVPVTPTEAGKPLILQARKTIAEAQAFTEMALHPGVAVRGTFRLGIIPTVAPYLLHRFVRKFLDTWKDVRLIVHELVTDEIVRQLEEGRLDGGILATPLQNTSLRIRELYKERFYVYAADDHVVTQKTYIVLDELPTQDMWLLEEGHCLRDQVIDLCGLRKRESEHHRLDYYAGSIESLIRIVDAEHGITIVPECAVEELSDDVRRARIRGFHDPAPVRTIALALWRDDNKRPVVDALVDMIRGVMRNNTVE